jgi:hypothetical protein
MPSFLITSEASDGAVTQRRLVAASWHDAWQALKDRRDDADAARIRNRTAGEVVDVEIHTGHQRIRIQSDPLAASRPTEAMATVAQGLAEARTPPASEPRAPHAATARIVDPWSSPERREDADALIVPGRPPDAARRPPLPPLTPSGFDETLPALSAEAFQGLSTWSGREPATAATVRPVARARRRPDTTEETLPAPSRTADHGGVRPVVARPTVPDGVSLKLPPDGDRLREGPQTFSPMADFGFALPASRQADGPVATSGILQWAIDTVAHQVPSRLVLGLELAGDALVITHARGEGDRALRAARSDAASWPAALDLSSPNRLRLAGDPLVTWWRDKAGVRHALELRAAMWACIELAATPARPAARFALLVIDPPRVSGFTEGELSALGYLTRMVAPRLG